jgi:hypothetical protein
VMMTMMNSFNCSLHNTLSMDDANMTTGFLQGDILLWRCCGRIATHECPHWQIYLCECSTFAMRWIRRRGEDSTTSSLMSMFRTKQQHHNLLSFIRWNVYPE